MNCFQWLLCREGRPVFLFLKRIGAGGGPGSVVVPKFGSGGGCGEEDVREERKKE